MKYALYILVILDLFVQAAPAETLLYDNAPFPEGSRVETLWVEQGFLTAGQFGHAGTQNARRCSNDSTGMLTVIHSDHFSVSLADGGLFNAISIDLAEYSVVYRIPTRIEFFATGLDGVSMSTEFLTDGLFDGPGGINDFQTFYFPEWFTNLTSLQTKTIDIFNGDNCFSMDNLTVQNVPEANSITYLLGAGLALAFRRFAKCRLGGQIPQGLKGPERQVNP